MGVPPGTRLGPYEVVAPLGAGGMGEVYRARDTRPAMAREVAVKLLGTLAHDAEGRARFERESRITAAIAHPNVVALFDTGVHEGTPYLVEELLTGTTLRERMRAGPVTPRRAVEWMRQVALGLAAAHARDLVHRDVKPENIVLTDDGRVKVLDFGLAKAASAPAGATSAATVTGDALTSGQVVLGTVGYMSPEQVRGQALDHRSDIFSLGVVLYELLTGLRPFDRATPADTMSAILTADPVPLSQSGAPVPAALERLVARCLEKAPADRFQSTRDLAFALETMGSDTGTQSGVHASSSPPRAVPIALRLAMAVAGLGLAFFGGRATSVSPAPRVTTRFQIEVDGHLTTPGGGVLALSHDGRTLALAVDGPDGVRRMHTRRFDEASTRVVPDAEDVRAPFFSPDDRTLGFVVGNEVRRVALGSGRPEVIWRSTVTNTLNLAGVDWYGPRALVIGAGARSLYSLADAGAPPVSMASLALAEFGHMWPQVVSGGTQVLYVSYPANDNPADASVMVQSIEGGQPRVVQRGSTFARQSDNYLLYESGGAIVASRFDPAALRPYGPAVPVVASAGPRPAGALAVGGNHTLAYFESEFLPDRQLEWLDANGVSPLAIPTLDVLDFALSPDASFVVAVLGNLGHYLAVVDTRTGTTTRLTTDIHAHSPLVSPDGSAVVFNSGGALMVVDIRAGSVPKALPEGTGTRTPYAWMPDGKTLVFTEVSQETGADIWSMDPRSSAAPTLLVRTAGHDRYPAVSADGAWIAFTSDESGREEVFVQPLDRPGPRRRVSLGGGISPLWAPNGRRLHWRTANDILTVDIDAAGAVQGRPVVSATGAFVSNPPYTSYAVGRDGRLLVARIPPQRQVSTMNVVLNWDVEIERLISEAEAKR